MKRPAFTFLELLIAVSLFSVGILSVLKIFPVNRRFLTQSANTTQAAYLAQEEIETVRAVAYDDLDVGTLEAQHALGASTGDPFGQYQRQTVVSLIDTNWAATATDSGLKKVVTTITWTEHGIARSYQLATYVSKQ